MLWCGAPVAAGPGGRAGKAGAPIFLSHPHYCGADPALAGGVAGLACNPEQHELYLDVGELAAGTWLSVPAPAGIKRARGVAPWLSLWPAQLLPLTYPSARLPAEPTTGITLRAAKRLMLSSWFGGRWAAVEPRARDTFLPIMWASESAEVGLPRPREGSLVWWW